jgi:hypothetical protein
MLSDIVGPSVWAIPLFALLMFVVVVVIAVRRLSGRTDT